MEKKRLKETVPHKVARSKEVKKEKVFKLKKNKNKYKALVTTNIKLAQFGTKLVIIVIIIAHDCNILTQQYSQTFAFHIALSSRFIIGTPIFTVYLEKETKLIKLSASAVDFN